MNDDLISRSALKKAIDDYIEEKTLHWLSDIEEIIDNAPAVESVSMDLHEKILDQTISELFKCQEELEKVRNGERSNGEWVRTGSLGNGNAQYECSNCHYGDEQAESQEVPYCWHCGASMKKVVQNENIEM